MLWGRSNRRRRSISYPMDWRFYTTGREGTERRGRWNRRGRWSRALEIVSCTNGAEFQCCDGEKEVDLALLSGEGANNPAARPQIRGMSEGYLQTVLTGRTVRLDSWWRSGSFWLWKWNTPSKNFDIRRRTREQHDPWTVSPSIPSKYSSHPRNTTHHKPPKASNTLHQQWYPSQSYNSPHH